jgi:hypothetical protein
MMKSEVVPHFVDEEKSFAYVDKWFNVPSMNREESCPQITDNEWTPLPSLLLHTRI